MAEDDFDLRELKGAWDRATPRPDPEVRAAQLRLAQEGFERLHATVPPTRAGIGARLRKLLGDLALPGVGAATALAAVALLMVTPTGQGLLRGPLPAGEADGALPQGASGKGSEFGGRGARVGASEEAVAEAVPSAEPAAPTAESVVSEREAAQAVESLERERPAQATEAPEAEEALTAQVAEEASAPPLVEGGALRSSTAVEAQEATQSPASEGDLSPEPPLEPSTTALAEAVTSEVAPAADEVGAVMARTEDAASNPPNALAAAAPPDGEAAARVEASDGRSADAVQASPVDGLTVLAPPSAGMAADAALGIDHGSAASLAAVRTALRAGKLPAPEAVDVQELVQALAPSEAAGGRPLGAMASVLPAPWDASQRLVVVAVEAGAPVEGAEIVLDGAATLGGEVPLGNLAPGRSAVRVLLIDRDGPTGPVRLGWTDPATGQRREAEVEVEAEAPPGARLATAVAGWALLLRDGEGSLRGWGFREAAALAEATSGAEAAELMRLSEKAAR